MSHDIHHTSLRTNGRSCFSVHAEVLEAFLIFSVACYLLYDSQLEKISFNSFESSSKFSAHAGSTGTICAPLTFILSS